MEYIAIGATLLNFGVGGCSLVYDEKITKQERIVKLKEIANQYSALEKTLSQQQGQIKREIVMTKGMEITTETQTGIMKILAGDGFERRFSWDSCERTVILEPRDKRWLGDFGIYHGGFSIPEVGYWTWKECDGIARPVVTEGQQHFKSEDQALAWISSQKWIMPVYTSDGLVVGWRKVPERKQLSVNITQIYINGSKPSKLKGSDDSKISIRHIK